jgi:hypothetical protein
MMSDASSAVNRPRLQWVASFPYRSIREKPTKAASRQIMRYLFRDVVLATQIQKYRRVNPFQSWRIVGSKRRRCIIRPVAVCVEILNTMQSASKPFNSRALGSRKDMHLQCRKRESAIQCTDIDFWCNNPRSIINDLISGIDPFFNPGPHMTYTYLKLIRSLLTRNRILEPQSEKLSIQKIRIVAMRFRSLRYRIKHIWSPDCSIRALANIDI